MVRLKISYFGLYYYKVSPILDNLLSVLLIIGLSVLVRVPRRICFLIIGVFFTGPLARAARFSFKIQISLFVFLISSWIEAFSEDSSA